MPKSGEIPKFFFVTFQISMFQGIFSTQFSWLQFLDVGDNFGMLVTNTIKFVIFSADKFSVRTQ